MSSHRFEEWVGNLQTTGDICPVKLGMTRRDLEGVIGPPDDAGGQGQRGLPKIWLYGDLEFHFGPHDDDPLECIFQDDGDGNVSLCIRRSVPPG